MIGVCKDKREKEGSSSTRGKLLNTAETHEQKQDGLYTFNPNQNDVDENDYNQSKQPLSSSRVLNNDKSTLKNTEEALVESRVETPQSCQKEGLSPIIFPPQTSSKFVTNNNKIVINKK